MSKNKIEENVHKHHRQRVFQEIEQIGLEVLPEHRVMEYLLFFCVHRRDTNKMAHDLINKFGSFSAVLDASESDLQEVEGVGPAVAKFLHALPAINEYYLRKKAKETASFNTTEERVKHILPIFRSKSKEAFCMFSFDSRGKLLKTITLEEGTIHSVNADLKKIATLAVQSNASSVILAHNHPTGLAVPSQGDINVTAGIIRALGVLEISVRDHIVVAGDEYYSMKDNEQLPHYNMKTHELRYFL